MSDLSVSWRAFLQLCAGQITLSQFLGGEYSLLQANVKALPAAAQPAAQLALSSVGAGAAAVAAWAGTALQPVLSEATSTQVEQVMNILSALGIAPNGSPLTLAEQAVVSNVITVLKAGLDHIGVQVAANGSVSLAPAPSGSASAAAPVVAEASGGAS